MVTIIPPKTNVGTQIGSALGEGLSKSMSQAAQRQYERGQLQQALSNLRQQGQNPNATPTDLLYNLIEASSYSPEIGRNLPGLYSELNKAREAEAIKKMNFGKTDTGIQNQFESNFEQGSISPPHKEINPEIQQAILNRNLGTEQLQNERPGQAPQESTRGIYRPVYSGEDLFKLAPERVREYAKYGVIKTLPEAMQELQTESQANQIYNDRVAQERSAIVQSQIKYGDLAEQYLNSLFPKDFPLSERTRAIFRKKGEEISGQLKSEADIRKYLSEEATNFKNSVSAVQKNISAPRFQNKISRLLSGKTTNINEAEIDARNAIKPLLNIGAIDESREILSDTGFYPEERERIIFGNVSENIQKMIPKSPSAEFKEKKGLKEVGPIKGPPKNYELQEKLKVYDSLSNIFNGKNENVNLLLLRKAYEDKGYDWRIFKDSLNELVQSNHIELTQDQENQFNRNLNSAPMGIVEELLHGLDLIGR